MNRSKMIFGAAVVALFAAGAAQAADPAAGKAKYDQNCAVCHGERGISVAPIYPNVAGQKEPYLVEQLKAFRDGQRPNDIMAPMAKGLSNIDIAHLSAYLSQLRP